MKNLDAFKNAHVVQEYCSQHNLFQPEILFLNKHKNELERMSMLDIGIGAGRTTEHFAKIVQNYVGIDYSDLMIEKCKEKFEEIDGHIFTVCDVRDMSMFADNTFDFVLFSFNGLDYVSELDRTRALVEIRRVIKRGGFFMFSSHNLQSVKSMYQLNTSSGIIKLLRSLIKVALIFLINGRPSKLLNKDIAIINDGAHKFKLSTCYIKPAKQINDLNTEKFGEVLLYSIDSGEIIPVGKYNMTTEVWHYYLCRAQ